MLTREERSQIIHDSCRECNLDSYITTCEKSSDLITVAQKIMGWTGFIKNNPHKNSYLYFDSVDACFYINDSDEPWVTFGAKWSVGANDLSLSKFAKAITIINKMLETMKAKINELQKEEL
jgi:hypothetical protein